jgi:hypothetical protein
MLGLGAFALAPRDALSLRMTDGAPPCAGKVCRGGTSDALRRHMSHSALPLPPQPPDTQSRLRLSRAQRIGLPVMALVPLLALAGFFGERMEQRRDLRGPLLVSAQVPTRLRYRQRMTLELSVTNRGAAAVHDVRVHVDSSYVDRFSGVSFSPQASPDGSVRFGTLAPSESGRLAVTLEGEHVGVVRGAAIATDAAGDTARVALASAVFP